MNDTTITSAYFQSLGAAAENWTEYLAQHEGTPEDQQRRFVGQSGVPAFDEALHAVNQFLSYGKSMGVEPKPGAKLLDFGCGWGRITKASMRYFEPTNITSVDIVPEALDMLRASELPVTTVQSGPAPPLELAANTYDYVFAFSVFSHLKESVAKAWMEEFRRILKPGGLIAVTTRPRGFISWAQELRSKSELPAHASGTDQVFLDTEECLRRYDAGEFVFDQERVVGPLKGAGYGEACIPGGYVEREWGPIFRAVRFSPAHEVKSSQSLILCVK